LLIVVGWWNVVELTLGHVGGAGLDPGPLAATVIGTSDDTQQTNTSSTTDR
jgi:hypothetical protein